LIFEEFALLNVDFQGKLCCELNGLFVQGIDQTPKEMPYAL